QRLLVEHKLLLLGLHVGSFFVEIALIFGDGALHLLLCLGDLVVLVREIFFVGVILQHAQVGFLFVQLALCLQQIDLGLADIRLRHEALGLKGFCILKHLLGILDGDARHLGVFLRGVQGLGIGAFGIGLQIDLRQLQLDVGGFDVGGVFAFLKIDPNFGGREVGFGLFHVQQRR